MPEVRATDMTARTDDDRRSVAADWVVRLQAPNISLDEAAEFDAWLSANTANGRAFDAALGVMQEVEASAPEIAARLPAAPVRRSAASRTWIAVGGLAAVATLALAVVPFGSMSPAPAQVFATAKGEHRTV